MSTVVMFIGDHLDRQALVCLMTVAQSVVLVFSSLHLIGLGMNGLGLDVLQK